MDNFVDFERYIQEKRAYMFWEFKNVKSALWAVLAAYETLEVVRVYKGLLE